MTNNETKAQIAQLEVIVRNETVPVAERRAALRRIAILRGESGVEAASVPAEDLRNVVAGMLIWERIGVGPGLTLRDSMEATASGRAQRGAPEYRR